MDIPILKYLDIVIGFAVVMLMGSVLVTAVTQFALSITYARARYLRDGLSGLIRQIDRQELPESVAQYVASRLLRNPLIGRAPSPVGMVFTWVRNRARMLLGKAELPAVNPADVIQREELVLFLLQWASGEGLLLSQDEDKYAKQAAERIGRALKAFAEAVRTEAQRTLDEFIENAQGGRWNAMRICRDVWGMLRESNLRFDLAVVNTVRIYRAVLDRRLEEEARRIRESIKGTLARLGVADPAAALVKIRERAVENERASPGAASQAWYAEAIASTVSAQLLGRLNTWFDNVIARVSDNFSLEAKIWSSAVALIIAVSVQLDSLALLKRLEADDTLRASLVAEAQQQTKAYEEAGKKLKEAEDLGKSVSSGESAGSEEREKLAMNLAAEARVRIAEQLAAMREPRFALIPAHFIWQPVANLDLNDRHLGMEGDCGQAPLEAVLRVDGRRYTLKLGKDPNRRLIELATAIRSAGAPVTVSPDTRHMRLTATSVETAEIRLERPPGARCYLTARSARPWKRAHFWSLSPPDDAATPLAFRFPDFDGLGRKAPGIFLSFVLLSLGGPFWYNTLKRALNFRSALAFKDDDERNARQADKMEARQQGRTQT